ncbi:hypothetical protein Hjap01_00302 [Haloarcula japonica]
MFTGKYASEIGVHAKSEQLTCNEATLAETLYANGYKTQAISGNLLASPMNAFDRGFEEFHHTGRAKLRDDNVFSWKNRAQNSNLPKTIRELYMIGQCALSDSSFIQSIKIGWKLKFGNRFDSANETLDILSATNFGDEEFVFINIMNAHAPYYPPEKYRTTEYTQRRIDDGIHVKQSNLVNQKQAYKNAVNYLSDIYKLIFEILQQNFDYVITVSDHGELFGEHNTSKHHYGVYPELTHVPVNIYHDDLDTESIDATVSLLDVHKTILDLAGIDAPSRGQNLIENPTSREYLTESHGLRTSQLQTLKQSDIDPEFLEMIDQPLRGIAMPENYYGYETPQGEFIEQGEPEKTVPQSKIENLIEAMDITEIDVQEMPDNTMSEDIKSQLQDLGYM